MILQRVSIFLSIAMVKVIKIAFVTLWVALSIEKAIILGNKQNDRQNWAYEPGTKVFFFPRQLMPRLGAWESGQNFEISKSRGMGVGAKFFCRGNFFYLNVPTLPKKSKIPVVGASVSGQVFEIW